MPAIDAGDLMYGPDDLDMDLKKRFQMPKPNHFAPLFQMPPRKWGRNRAVAEQTGGSAWQRRNFEDHWRDLVLQYAVFKEQKVDPVLAMRAGFLLEYL